MITQKYISKKPLRIVHLTNIPTPYRVNFFNYLKTVLDQRGIELYIVYCSHSEPNRDWQIDDFDFNYERKFLKGTEVMMQTQLYLSMNIKKFYQGVWL